MKINKRGFTLIELLAVIAILAILIVIAVPTVLKVFNSSKEQAFVTQAQSLFKAAEQQIITDQIKGDPIPTQFCWIYTVPDTYASGSGTVDLDGTKKLSYNILLTNGKITTFEVSNGDYSITPDPSAELTVSDIEGIDDTRTAVTSCN